MSLCCITQLLKISMSMNAESIRCSRVSCRLLCSAVSSALSHSSAEGGEEEEGGGGRKRRRGGGEEREGEGGRGERGGGALFVYI